MLCFEPTVKVATKESRQSHDKKSRDGEVATKKIAKKKEGIKKKKSPKKGKESENFGGQCFRGQCFRGLSFRGQCFRGQCYRGLSFRGLLFSTSDRGQRDTKQVVGTLMRLRNITSGVICFREILVTLISEIASNREAERAYHKVNKTIL